MSFQSVQDGSITSPEGYLASGIAAGLKKSGSADTALLFSETPAHAAAAFTPNKFQAAPVLYDREIVELGQPVRAVIINSGNANACTGKQGLADAGHMAERTAALLDCNRTEILVSSTGRIGVPMPMDTVLAGIEKAAAALRPDGGLQAADAILTTDTCRKTLAVSLMVDGREVTIAGMAKGAGMIAPRLRAVSRPAHATMLAYVTSDAAVTPDFLQECLARTLDDSFNRITVDGDTSTNDTFIALANGRAGNRVIDSNSPDAPAFQKAFQHVVSQLARAIILDAEGATRFVELRVFGARTAEQARRCAETVANSVLCKTAWFGADPNWGRVLDAAGNADVDLDPERVSLDYSGVPIVREGMDAGTPESEQVQAIDRPEFRIDLDLAAGDAEFIIWTCDLSYEYVRINAEYHT